MYLSLCRSSSSSSFLPSLKCLIMETPYSWSWPIFTHAQTGLFTNLLPALQQRKELPCAPLFRLFYSFPTKDSVECIHSIHRNEVSKQTRAILNCTIEKHSNFTTFTVASTCDDVSTCDMASCKKYCFNILLQINQFRCSLVQILLRLYYEIETRARFVMLAYGYTMPIPNNANSVNRSSNGLRDTAMERQKYG